MKHIISFSGGKDSTAMLLRLIEKKVPIDQVVMVDTTKEFPDMYNHIRSVEALIRPIPMTVLTLPYDYWFSDHIKTKGKNKGKRGYGWPDFRNRWCTALKRDMIQAYLSNIGPHRLYIGISADEAHRTIHNQRLSATAAYPLIDDGMTGEDNLAYCYKAGLNWSGLYQQFNRVSCYCCPLSRIGELEQVYRHYPDLWKKMQLMDAKSFRSFRSDYTMSQLTDKFRKRHKNRTRKTT